MNGARTSPGPGAVHEQADGRDPLVLLLHGSAEGSSTLADWNPLLKILRTDFHCVAKEVVGLDAVTLSHPQGQGAAAANSIVIADLLDDQGADRFTVLGSGLGCGIALQLAELLPERVQAVVLSAFESVREASEQWPDMPARLATVIQPTLVVHGRHDRVTPLTSSYDLATHIPTADLYVLPGSRHWVHLEQPERFTTAVHDFVRRHSS